MKMVIKLQKFFSVFVEATKLHVLYGMILATPAKEIKKMKLRQIEKELKMLNIKVKKRIKNER